MAAAQPGNLLFLRVASSPRSQMAEGPARRILGDRVRPLRFSMAFVLRSVR